jgi:hypothetical protein
MCWKRKLQLQHGSEEGEVGYGLVMVKLGGVRNPLVETQAERDALNKVKLNKFAVVPATVSPYGTVTASWDATVPNTGFEIALKLNGQVVANTGSKTFTVSQRTEFTLAAVIDDPPEPLAATTELAANQPICSWNARCERRVNFRPCEVLLHGVESSIVHQALAVLDGSRPVECPGIPDTCHGIEQLLVQGL